MDAESLRWTIYRSFCSYVSRLADGRIEATGGAEVLDDSSFRFPAAMQTDTASAAATDAAHFTGTISFSGHNGMMAVAIAAPSLEPATPGDGSWQLVIDDPFEPSQRMAFAILPEGPVSGVVPRLTEEGADLFMGTYPPGMELDPLDLETPPALPHDLP